jgi:hypothetical protein
MNSDSMRQTRSSFRYRASRLARLLTVVAAVSVSLGAASGASAAGSATGLAKSYSGAARNVTAGESAGITLSGVTENGGSISGTFAFHAPLSGTGPFKGTITGTTVKFTVTPTAASCAVCQSIVFTGAVSPLVSMSGTWVAHLKSGAPQNGTWQVGSTWTGTAHNITLSVSSIFTLSQLTESATGVVAGAATWVISGAPTETCNIAGSVHGSTIKFTCNYAGYAQDFTGTLNPVLGTMGGSYTNSYESSHGTWQLHRSGATSTAV